MFIAKVKGNVVATQKVPKMSGKKLLVVEPLRVDDAAKSLPSTQRSLVAVDALGAGTDDLVLVTQGSSARMTDFTNDAPVDCVVIGIIDSVATPQGVLYSKNAKAAK